MQTKKPLSETAQWFLEELQRTLQDFADREGIQVVIINKDRELVAGIYGTQRVCRLILATEEGRIRCKDHFRSALSLVKNKMEPIFTECYAGFASVWVPIIIRGSLIGVIICCGGRHNEEEREKFERRISELADEIGIIDKRDFIKAARDEVLVITKEEIQKRADRLTELFDILSQSALTPLKEIFG